MTLIYSHLSETLIHISYYPYEMRSSMIKIFRERKRSIKKFEFVFPYISLQKSSPCFVIVPTRIQKQSNFHARRPLLGYSDSMFDLYLQDLTGTNELGCADSYLSRKKGSDTIFFLLNFFLTIDQVLNTAQPSKFRTFPFYFLNTLIHANTIKHKSFYLKLTFN
jgi:hypothetical protein